MRGFDDSLFRLSRIRVLPRIDVLCCTRLLFVSHCNRLCHGLFHYLRIEVLHQSIVWHRHDYQALIKFKFKNFQENRKDPLHVGQVKYFLL